MPVQIGLLDDKGDELVSPRLSIDSDDPVQIRTDPETGASNLLLQLRSARAELVVGGLDQRPVVSFLRGFSAPVRVDYPRDHDELAFLALHDSDGFARWDALQTLVVAEIQRLHEASDPSDRVVALFGSLVQRALASPDEAGIRALLATMLTLPDENYLFEQLGTVDVDAVCDASDRLRQQLARAHAESWLALYEQNRPLGAFKPEPLDMARRSLKHAALTFVASAAEAEGAKSLLGDHYDAADNLTDRRGALVQITRLAHIGDEFRQRVLNDFFARWQDESLVVNLWFALQAASPLSGVEQLRELATHPAFDAHNPNKLRALYGSFANQNHRNFHNLDGSGYRFLADAVIDLDWANPQVAARLTTPLTRWRRYQPDRQRLMRAELERIAGGDQLSADLFEVVTKSLA
jgi:aminopeptidase N